MRTPHTSTYKGKKVFIILRDGTRLTDRFLDHKSGCVILAHYGRLSVKDIRSFSINRLSP